MYTYKYVSLLFLDYCYSVAILLQTTVTIDHRRGPCRQMDLGLCPNSRTGFYNHFDNLRFISSQANNDLSAAWPAFHLNHLVICFSSSDIMQCKLLK